VSAFQVEIAFAQLVDEVKQDSINVSRDIPRKQKDLRESIFRDISDRLKRIKQYNYSEREFVVRVFAQNKRIPKENNETYLTKILPFAEQAPNRNMLEIGFGDGSSFPFFNDWNYLGLEVSSYAIWKARQKKAFNGKKLRRTKNGKKFPVNDGSLDFILAYNSMHDIENWEFELDECVRTLSNKGRIYIVERTGAKREFNFSNIDRFDKDYNVPEQIAEYLSRKGLEVEVEKHQGTYFGEALVSNGFFSFQHVKAVKD
jgi:SAM-dependent methyltransferase